MNLPISTASTGGLFFASLFGLLFGILLNKGRVTDYNVIVNLFRLRDFTVIKIMLTAIVVGGLGVFAMMSAGWLEGYHIKDANLLGVIVGSALFGIGMVLYGYCPGTGVAAVATGSLHAAVGFLGMLAGGIAYAATYAWVDETILSVWTLGKVRLPEITGIPTGVWWLMFAAVVPVVFLLLERFSRRIGEPKETA